MEKMTKIWQMITNQTIFLYQVLKNRFIIYNCPYWGRGAFFSCYSILLKNRPKRPRFSGKIKFIASKTFFSKKMRVCFLQLFDPSTPKASNCDPTSHKYFTRKHSYKNSFKQCKISYNLIKFCQIRELYVSTESRDNFLCFCTLSMVTIKSINKSTFHFSLMSPSYAAFQLTEIWILLCNVQCNCTVYCMYIPQFFV